MRWDKCWKAKGVPPQKGVSGTVVVDFCQCWY